MDTSHLFMGSNYYNFDASFIIGELRAKIKWYHISGAAGIDGEGVNFNSMSESESRIIKDIISSDRIKIIEVWQGHLDKYFGFQQALENIQKRFNHD
jgi:hypothetical protein